MRGARSRRNPRGVSSGRATKKTTPHRRPQRHDTRPDVVRRPRGPWRGVRVAALVLLVVLAASAALAQPPDAARVEDFAILAPWGGGSVATTLDGGLVQYWWSNGTARHLTRAPAGIVGIDPRGAWAVACSNEGCVLHPLEREEGARVAPAPRAVGASDAGFAMVFPEDDRVWLHPWSAPAEGSLRAIRVDFAEDARISRGTRVTEAADQPEFNGSFARGIALSPAGGRVAVADGTRLLLLNATTERVEALPAPELDAEPLVGMAFSRDERFLAVLTRPSGRFAELRVYDVEAGGAQVGLHRAAESPLSLAWGEAGLAVTYTDTTARWSMVVRVFPDASSTAPFELRREDVPVSTGLAWHGGRLFVGLRAGILVLDERLDEAFATYPGRPAAYPERAAAQPAPSPDAPTALAPPPERVVPGFAWWIGALTAALISFRRRPPA